MSTRSVDGAAALSLTPQAVAAMGAAAKQVSRRESKVKSESMVELEIEKLSFFSHRDESNLFTWLNGIGSVQEVYGRGHSILVKVVNDQLTDDDLLELISVFSRYRIQMHQFAVFDDGRFPWLKKRQAFWYRAIFG